jgi:hypothetical protein
MRVSPISLLAGVGLGLVGVGAGLGLQTRSATGAEIHTGGETGAYQTTFCPALVAQLGQLGQPSDCVTSEGTGENLRRVARSPESFGYGQLDVFALEADRYGRDTFEIVRADDVRECVFAVTRNKSYTNYGEIAVNADRLRFILPPEASGSAKTFAYLQKIDPDGLGRGRTVINATDTDEAIRMTLADEDAVTFFVQFPDPANERFKTIRRLDGHLVPVIDSVILRQEVDGRTVYFAKETPISQLKWLNLGRRVVTVCTPLVLFTGASNRITGTERRAEHRQLVLNIRAMRREELVPRGSPVARILEQTRQLSARARFHFQELSMTARERAKPFVERMYNGARHFVRLMVLKARPPEYIDD